MSSTAAAAAAIGNPKDDEQMMKVEDAASSSPEAAVSSDARYYSCDAEKLQTLQQEKPWMKDAKYFKNVALSPSAVMKMMMHCASGVEKGVKQGGNPIEVMGLLLGRPDPTSPTTLIVTDAFPLPIEGFETRVIADDQAVVNHMIALGECLERSRKEKFMGWYHSHPFDLGSHSHCFLSQTDLSTQLQWQRAEDPHGNPFVAIVLDPLRSVHVGTPELKAFRAFPPEYTSPVTNQCPDGSVQHSEQLRLEHWGSCWNRYYELKVDYYMSSTSRYVLEQLTQTYLWMTNFKRKDEEESVQQTKQVASAWTASMSGNSAATSAVPLVDPDPPRPGGAGAARPADWQPAVAKLQTLATQELARSALCQVQKQVFPKSI
mmetsp:Transcript_127253/g.189684  ORF Transcript_127253/g.189684 Transcript_127253/m.189684 type:complete len:375 (-) Transcript_127253:8-1132(-)